MKRVALITGSTSGIGEGIARLLIKNNFIVALHSNKSIEKGEALAKELGNASYTQADLSEHENIPKFIEEIISKHGRIDVLINNAGISEVIPHNELKKATSTIWNKLHNVNVIAPWLLITELEDSLRKSATKEQTSCIINITSHAGVRPKGASIPYSVSKAALNHMTKLLAVTLGNNIRVNAIAPGLVDTPMTKSWKWAHEIWENNAPMARAAQPLDIAQVALMLINSDYLTGEVIIVDGGLNLV